MRWCTAFGLGLAWVLVTKGVGAAAELSLAAAADLKFALDELASEFQTNRPSVNVRVTYGSSGNFYAQLQNRAPYDLFLSADIAYPRKLAEAGFAEGTNVFLYAVGRIVVWVPKQSSVDVKALGMRALLAPAVKRIAVANPQHAPYGRAAVAAMKSLGIFNEVEPKLVYGENIAQAAKFVQSGAADIGIIALSLAAAPPMREAGRYWEVPPDSYPKIEQGGMIVKGTKQVELARAFREMILGKRGGEVLKRYGFSLPEQ